MKGETVRTLLVVSVVAVLVWLFAESRTLQTRTVTLPVEIGAGGVFRVGPDLSLHRIFGQQDGDRFDGLLRRITFR